MPNGKQQKKNNPKNSFVAKPPKPTGEVIPAPPQKFDKNRMPMITPEDVQMQKNFPPQEKA
jgi:hypothetical protein